MPFAIERGVTVTATPAAPLRRRRARPRRARRVRPSPSRADGWRAFARGMVAELRAAGYDVAPAHLEITGDLPAGQRPVAPAPRSRRRSRSPCSGDAPRTSRRSPSSARASRTTGWAPRPACWTSSRACCRAQAHVLRIDFRSLEVAAASRSTSATGSWSPSSPAPPTPTPARATTSAAPSAAPPARRSASPRLRDAHDLAALDGTLLKRARHVVSENARVDATADALARAATCRRVGELLDASHASLRDDYEASVPRSRPPSSASRPPEPPEPGWSAAASAARCWRYCPPVSSARRVPSLVAPRAPARLL